MPGATVVIPCYQEALRLDTGALRELAAADGIRLLVVDDGSTDGTTAILRELTDGEPDIGLLVLSENSGKAEAVRRGVARAIAEGAEIVAYYDADLSTPPRELLRLVGTLEADAGLQVVMAARVALLGREIERRAYRHYLGRVFATFASLSLALTVYDTQCGAKVFRVTPGLEAAIAKPFRSRWSFDVELLARLMFPESGVDAMPSDAIVEVPLEEWHDVAGSKLKLTDMVAATFELARVARDVRLRRRGQQR